MAREQKHPQAAEPPDDHPVDDETRRRTAEDETCEQLERPHRAKLRVAEPWQAGIGPHVPRHDLAGAGVISDQNEEWKERVTRVPDRYAAAENQLAIDEDEEQRPQGNPRRHPAGLDGASKDLHQAESIVRSADAANRVDANRVASAFRRKPQRKLRASARL